MRVSALGSMWVHPSLPSETVSMRRDSSDSNEPPNAVAATASVRKRTDLARRARNSVDDTTTPVRNSPATSCEADSKARTYPVDEHPGRYLSPPTRRAEPTCFSLEFSIYNGK